MIDWDVLVLAPTVGIFGEPVTFTNAAGTPFAVTGVFDEAYREVNLVDAGAVTTEHPVLGIRTSEFPSLPLQGETITVASRGKTYTIRETQIDGHGGAKLLLNNA